MSQETERYSYSHNETDYYGDFPTREEALYQADGKPGDIIWTGRQVAVTIGDFTPSTSSIFEMCQDNAAEEAPDNAATGWLEYVPISACRVLQDRLQDLLEAWANEFGEQPNFFLITDIEEHRVEG